MIPREPSFHVMTSLLLVLIVLSLFTPSQASVTNRFISGKASNGSDFILEVVGENSLDNPKSPDYTITLTMGSFGPNVTNIQNIIFTIAFYSVVDASVLVKTQKEASPIKYAGSGSSQVMSLTVPESYHEVSLDLYFGASFSENVSNSMKTTQISLQQAFTIRLTYNLSTDSSSANASILPVLAVLSLIPVSLLSKHNRLQH